MSVGSETQGLPGLTAADDVASSDSGIGISDVDIYDITIDGDTRSTGGAPGATSTAFESSPTPTAVASCRT